jgi:hypothetical protein
MRIKILKMTLLGVSVIVLITSVLKYETIYQYFFDLGCRTFVIIK